MTDGADESLATIDLDRAARIVGTVPLLGQPVEVAVIAVLDLSDGKATIAPRDVRLGDGTPLPIDDSARQAILEQFTQPLDTGALPLQVTPETFMAKDGVLQISGTASGLQFGGATPSASN